MAEVNKPLHYRKFEYKCSKCRMKTRVNIIALHGGMYTFCGVCGHCKSRYDMVGRQPSVRDLMVEYEINEV